MLTQSRNLEMQDASSTDAHVEARLQLLKASPKTDKSPTRNRISPVSRRLQPAPPIAPAPSSPSSAPSYGRFPSPTEPTTANNPGDLDERIHPELRAHPSASTNMLPAAVSTSLLPSLPTAMANSAMSPGQVSGDEPVDGRKAKRELSNSKRAAQNRAAQRAFRQRKEGYIKKLEQQVRDYEAMEEDFRAIQMENFNLREYVGHLQSRLMEVAGAYPPPPPNIKFEAQPVAPALAASAGPGAREATPSNTAETTQLEAVAQAVAGLRESERLSSEAVKLAAIAERVEESRANEELKQLNG